MRTVSVFACVLLWTAHAHAAPVDDALVAYDKFFAAFTTDNYEQIATFLRRTRSSTGQTRPRL